jgi:hypothetical protein
MTLKPLAFAMAAGLTLSACSLTPTQSSSRTLPADDPSVQIDMVGRYTSGIFDESAAEIVAFHQASGYAYLTNGATGRINAVRISNLLDEPQAKQDRERDIVGGVLTNSQNRRFVQRLQE